MTPPLGDLRTWHQICSTHTSKHDGKTKLSNLHSGLRKIIKTQNHTTLRPKHTIYSTILRKAREAGVDQSIRGYSTAPYRARRDTLEVAWGYMYTAVAENMAPQYIAQNANPH